MAQDDGFPSNQSTGLPVELLASASEFWKSADRRFDRPTFPSQALRQLPMCAWGVPGIPIVLASGLAGGITGGPTDAPHYRLVMPNNYRIVGWAVTADQPGTCSVNVEWSPFAPVPAYTQIHPNVSGPGLFNVQNSMSMDVTNWARVDLALFDILHIYLGSIDGILQEVMFHLFVRVVPRPRNLGSVTDQGGIGVVDAAGNAILGR